MAAGLFQSIMCIAGKMPFLYFSGPGTELFLKPISYLFSDQFFLQLLITLNSKNYNNYPAFENK
jgi:hypothetical protein